MAFPKITWIFLAVCCGYLATLSQASPADDSIASKARNAFHQPLSDILNVSANSGLEGDLLRGPRDAGRHHHHHESRHSKEEEIQRLKKKNHHLREEAEEERKETRGLLDNYKEKLDFYREKCKKWLREMKEKKPGFWGKLKKVLVWSPLLIILSPIVLPLFPILFPLLLIWLIF